jgi:hypothetical protein
MFPPSPRDVFGHSHFWYRLPLVSWPGWGRRLVADLSLWSSRAMQNLWWMKQQWDRFFSKHFCFALSVSFHQRYITCIDYRRHHINSVTDTVVKWNTSLYPIVPIGSHTVMSSPPASVTIYTHPALPARHHFVPGRRRQWIPPKRGHLAKRLQGYICQKTVLFSI